MTLTEAGALRTSTAVPDAVTMTSLTVVAWGSTPEASGMTVSARTGEAASRVEVIRPSPMRRFDRCIMRPQRRALGGRQAPGEGRKARPCERPAPNNHSQYCLNVGFGMGPIRLVA